MEESRKSFRIIGGHVEIIMHEVKERKASSYFEELTKEVIRLQSILDPGNPSSEISLLNKKRKMEVSNELLFVIRKGIELSIITSGSYDIAKGKKAKKEDRGNSLIGCSYKDVEIKRSMLSQKYTVALNHKDAMLDPGIIAKGYVAEKLAEFIKKKGIKNAFIDSKRDVERIERNPEQDSILDSRSINKEAEPTRFLYPLYMNNRAVATIKDYEEYYQSYDHCDTRKKDEFISVSVIAKTLMDADAIATAIFSMGLMKARAFLSQYTQFQVLAIDRGLNSHIFNGFGDNKSNIYGGVPSGA